MSLRNGVWVCIKAQIIALIWQIAGSWLLLDGIAGPMVNSTMPSLTTFSSTLNTAWDIIGYTKYVPLILSVGGFIYLFISPFIQEGSGDVLDR